MKKLIMKLKNYNNDMLKNAKGITLIALVVTIIVLLILVGVTLGLVFNSDGLFQKADISGKKYEEQIAREKLEVAFADLIAYKYENKEYDDAYMNKKLLEQGILLTEENTAIVDGYSFLIDRNVPKVLESYRKTRK